MSLLRHDDVLWYHPLDDFTEHIKNEAWDDKQLQIGFSDGIIVSGMTTPTGTSWTELNELRSDAGYTDIQGASRITTCFWVSGFFQNNSFLKILTLGYEVSLNENTFRFEITASNDVKYRVRIAGDGMNATTIVSRPTDDGWNFVVLDAVREGANWHSRISFNGGDWADIRTDVHDGAPSTNNRLLINIFDTNTSNRFIIDEVVYWKDIELFSSEELSNLYELANTYSRSMDQYSSTYGTPVNSGVDLFIDGNEQVSGNTSLYIPGQKETRSTDLFVEGSIQGSGDMNLYISGTPSVVSSSITLFMPVPTPVNSGIDLYITGPILFSGSLDNFIPGHQLLSGDVDTYEEGHETFSSSGDMYIFGVPFQQDSIDLYIQGPLPSTGVVENFIHGHTQISGTSNLFIAAPFPSFEGFVSVVANNPSNTIDLFVHGVPLGSPTIFYMSDTITLFIKDEGTDTTVNSDWPVFTRVADALLVEEEGAWQAFLRGGNTSDNNVSLYTYGHASGSSPHGTLVSGSISVFVDGLSSVGGEEGLLSDGYSASSTEAAAFTKVHLGVTDQVVLFTSGAITVTPPSSSIDLFTFGILGIPSGSHTSYIFGLGVDNDSCDLFIFGIQGIVSGDTTLYLEVTDIGLFNRSNTLYSHGF